MDETPEASTRSLTVTDFGGWTLGRFTSLVGVDVAMRTGQCHGKFLYLIGFLLESMDSECVFH